MPLKSSEALEEPNLNLTPMIDIVFLLIIFFMVGTQFAELERQYDIQLPTVTAAQPLTSLPDEIVVNILDAGRVQIGAEILTLEELTVRLTDAKQAYDGQAVVIRGDGAGPYQDVMNVLNICHNVDIHTISVANRLKNEGQ